MLFIASLEACGSQRDALMSIHAIANGKNWVNASNWGSNVDVCRWNGVKCNSQGLVTVLNLSNQNATGSIHSDIECLPYLQELILDNNNFIAEIPNEVCNLQHLEHLEAANASLIGRVPNCICTMKNLHYLHLQENNITGWFPLCVDRMSELRSLNLTCNNLHGISSTINNLELLTEVHSECNKDIQCLSNTTGNYIYKCDNNECPECEPSFIQCPSQVVEGGCTYVSPIHTFKDDNTQKSK